MATPTGCWRRARRTGWRLPHEPLPAEAFSTLLTQAEHHRLLGFLGAAVRDGAIAVDDDQRAELPEKLEGWLAHALRLEALLLATAEERDHAGIEHRVFKGIPLAHTVYDDPAMRVFADVDILISSPDFVKAALILESALDAQRAVPELRPGFDERFGREATLRSSTGLELDLHRTFVDGAYGLTVDLDDLFASPRRFVLGGRDIATLSPAHQLLSSCYSAALGDRPPRLASQRDIVQLLEVHALNSGDVLDLARRWRAEAVVARALGDAWAALEPRFTPPLVTWARCFRPTPLDRLLLASYRGPARGFTSKAAATLVVPGVTDKLAYLRALATPQRAYLEQRGLSPGGHWRRALARVRQRR